MAKIKRFKIYSPKIIGLISERTAPPKTVKKINSLMRKNKMPYVCLPFKVAARFLKNVTACMRLMDIEGLLIAGGHTRRMAKYVKLTAQAKKNKLINVVSRRGSQFVGAYVKDIASTQAIKQLKHTP